MLEHDHEFIVPYRDYKLMNGDLRVALEHFEAVDIEDAEQTVSGALVVAGQGGVEAAHQPREETVVHCLTERVTGVHTWSGVAIVM